MSLTTLLILIGVVVVHLALIVFALAKQYRKVGPNEVLIISGGRRRTITQPDGTKRKVGYRMHIGGGTFVLPFIESAQVLPLEVFTLTIEVPECLTSRGIAVKAVSQGQVKVGGNEDMIRLAAEQFLSKGSEGMKEISTQILEGYMRGALGGSTIEEVYQNRDTFSETVRGNAAADFARLGLEIVSFSLKDISDDQGYIEAMGRPRIAQVKADAAVAQAESDKEATVKSAIARKEGDVVKFQAETEIAQASRDYETRRAEFQAVINQKKAKSDLAYELERQRMNQQIRDEEYKVRMIEKEHNIELEEKEISRKEKELESTVMKAADARKYQVQAEAEAERFRIEALARANAEATKLEGTAEAEAMMKKAESWKDYNEAAIYQMVVEKLPELARAVSEPLSKVDKIVLVSSGDGSLGASRITGQVAEILAQLPTVIESLSGVDIKKLLENLPAFKGKGKTPSSSSSAKGGK
ncbi:MAG: flotillin [Candidatus Zixiibacteriota bacterium]|nr:MAG: flotillin [candidate division Zixibacteria bacterium]